MRSGRRTISLLTVLAGICLLASCAHDAGIIFPPLSDAPHWPEVGPPRIRYVGQLSSSADLKPAVSGFQAIGSLLFGGGTTDSIQNPMAVCTDNAGRVFIADTQGRAIVVMDMNSRLCSRWTTVGVQMQTPVGLAYDASAQRLLVADSTNASIYCFDADGKYAGTLAAGQFRRPCGIAIDPRNGRIFVADVTAHQVVVLTPTGEVIERLGSRGSELGEFNYPTYVALDSQGRLYVADSLNFRVQEFGPDLQPIRQIGSQGDAPGYFAQPKGLAIDRDDHLYVVDSQFEAIQIFDHTGQLLLDFGEQGRHAGEFWLPTGIFIDRDNRLWVADSANHRIQVFDYLPEATQ
ncbi:MAG TPA: 6-bladed beta-propeller [Tepidisphaeraceae bacterium]|nr:6-bladed beta-propeller [Tepidisphaeraceae bacterium]